MSYQLYRVRFPRAALRPKRPKRPSKLERMMTTLPYGLWLCRDGRVVLFNRRYQPIWQRDPQGRVSRADPDEWVKHICGQNWFYGQVGVPSPWRSRKTQKVCERVLMDFGVGHLAAIGPSRGDIPENGEQSVVGPRDAPLWIGFDP